MGVYVNMVSNAYSIRNDPPASNFARNELFTWEKLQRQMDIVLSSENFMNIFCVKMP